MLSEGPRLSRTNRLSSIFSYTNKDAALFMHEWHEKLTWHECIEAYVMMDLDDRDKHGEPQLYDPSIHANSYSSHRLILAIDGLSAKKKNNNSNHAENIGETNKYDTPSKCQGLNTTRQEDM